MSFASRSPPALGTVRVDRVLRRARPNRVGTPWARKPKEVGRIFLCLANFWSLKVYLFTRPGILTCKTLSHPARLLLLYITSSHFYELTFILLVGQLTLSDEARETHHKTLAAISSSSATASYLKEPSALFFAPRSSQRRLDLLRCVRLD